MVNLTKNQKLNIVRIGQKLTLEVISKKVFLSPSYVQLMCRGVRKVPEPIENILDFENGIKWYQTITTALSGDPISKEDAEDAIQVLNRVVGIKIQS